MPENDNHRLEEQHSNFSDVVQGEDLEFRQSNERTFPITHKIETLGEIPPPSILTRLSSNQLITIAGAASGFLAGVVVCPLDVVKTRLQAQGTMGKDRKYNGFLNTFKTILREEGARGLYRGLVPTMIGYLPTWTIYFTVYERAKRFYPGFLHKYNIENPSVIHFCSALTAGMTSSIAVNPIWVVKTRLMVQNGMEKKNEVYYKGTIDAFKEMYKSEGIRAFYSGLIPSLFGLLHVGIHFPVYEKLKTILHCSTTTGEQGSTLTLWRLIAASSISKMIASTITYPHEILRTRMQLRQDTGKSRSLLKTVVSIFRNEGLKGFYAGYFTNLARTVPASAVTLVSFEYFKTYLLEMSGKLNKKFTK
ncbi:Mitochondrial nicotinamide adenine dinucleotide transporter 1 [Candida viswanathii]|uniref:Mitochondrial thiamine pyrophosphate carrier 1 n=1 Tax=Candida viswanathii TaxID=5486 RepID=A0A367YM33_9ASCO|nr:Mitochondrial nicotinamide adenine dinucleotide transporter 1 [Candida viswanathii]